MTRRRKQKTYETVTGRKVKVVVTEKPVCKGSSRTYWKIRVGTSIYREDSFDPDTALMRGFRSWLAENYEIEFYASLVQEIIKTVDPKLAETVNIRPWASEQAEDDIEAITLGEIEREDTAIFRWNWTEEMEDLSGEKQDVAREGWALEYLMCESNYPHEPDFYYTDIVDKSLTPLNLAHKICMDQLNLRLDNAMQWADYQVDEALRYSDVPF